MCSPHRPQSVLIHDYAGRTVTFRTEARTEGGTGEAGLPVLMSS